MGDKEFPISPASSKAGLEAAVELTEVGSGLVRKEVS